MQKNKGALTVEACISLTIFLMVFLTILYLMRIVLAYGVVQHSINQVAKEISSYTYFYAASGLKSVDDTIQSSTQSGKKRFNESAESIVNVYTEFEKLGKTTGGISGAITDGDFNKLDGVISELESNIGGTKDAISGATDTIKSIVEDPVGALKAVGSVMLSGANETAKTAICGEISLGLMAKYISPNGYAASDARLKQMRIIDGLNGLNFSASTFWSNGSDIEIIVCYTIDPVFPIDVIDEINLMNRVKVRGWNGESIF